MKGNHLLQKQGFRAPDILDRLAGHGIGEETDEIARMTSLQGNTDFAVRLEPADPRTVPGARVDHHEGTPRGLGHDSFWSNNSDENIIDRPRERAAVHDEFDLEFEHVRGALGEV